MSVTVRLIVCCGGGGGITSYIFEIEMRKVLFADMDSLSRVACLRRSEGSFFSLSLWRGEGGAGTEGPGPPSSE